MEYLLTMGCRKNIYFHNGTRNNLKTITLNLYQVIITIRIRSPFNAVVLTRTRNDI